MPEKNQNNWSLKDWVMFLFGGLLVPIVGAVSGGKLWKDHATFAILIFIITAIVVLLIIRWTIRKASKKRAREFFSSKVAEIIHILIKRPDELEGKQFNVFEMEKELDSLVKKLKKFVCYNQGKVADYTFNLSIKHQKFKEESPTNIEELKSRFENIVKHLATLDEIFRINIDEYILPYFEGRSKYMPRVVIKIHQGELIKDRYRRWRLYKTEYRPDENTAFLHINSTGEYYLNNDIPTDTYEGQYKNPRLNPLKVKDYIQFLKKNNVEEDEERWIRCWEQNTDGDTETLPERDSCYMSTMVIPITLLNNRGLSDDLRDRFEIPTPPFKKDTLYRAFFGYLCFDHRYRNFFNEKRDPEIGYIFADILSLYLFADLNYTKRSESFKELVDIVAKKYPQVKDITNS